MTSVNAVNYNATTKNGAPYHKTSAGKKTGVTIGALASAGTLAYGVDILRKVTAKPGEQPVKFFTALKDYLKTYPLSSAGAIGKAMLIGLITGAIVDRIVNKIRAKKADKALNTQA